MILWLGGISPTDPNEDVFHSPFTYNLNQNTRKKKMFFCVLDNRMRDFFFLIMIANLPTYILLNIISRQTLKFCFACVCTCACMHWGIGSSFLLWTWPGHVTNPIIQQYWRVDCIYLNNGSFFSILFNS